MLLNVIDTFTEDIIFESLMNFYKDFNYANYVLDLDFETGYKLFVKMRDREIEIIKQKSKDNAYQMYLREKTELTFGEYYEQITKNAETKAMDSNDKEEEEARIKAKFANVDLSQYRKV